MRCSLPVRLRTGFDSCALSLFRIPRFQTASPDLDPSAIHPASVLLDSTICESNSAPSVRTIRSVSILELLGLLTPVVKKDSDEAHYSVSLTELFVVYYLEPSIIVLTKRNCQREHLVIP